MSLLIKEGLTRWRLLVSKKMSCQVMSALQDLWTTTISIISIGLFNSPLIAADADVALWRLDCGRFDNVDQSVESDDDRYVGKRRNGANGCYLIRHGEDYMLWDVGISVGLRRNTAIATVTGPDRSITAQIAEIG